MADQQKARLWLYGIGVGALVGVAAMNTLTTIYVADSVRPAQESRTLLVECVTPPGLRTPPEDHPRPDDCYVRSQTQQGDVIGEPKAGINTVSVAAAACGAAHPGDVPATLRCTRKAVGQ